jgi:streptomycin 6-kinase
VIATVRVPPEIAESVRDRWPDMAAGWPRAVERELGDVCARFGAVPSEVLPARYSFVVVANTRHGDRIVRVTPDPDAMNQARAAQMLAECGAGPRIHEVRATSLGVWTISDRVVPGISLREVPPGSVSLDDMVAPFRAMAGVRAAVDSLPALGEWLRFRLAQPNLRDVPRGQSVASLPERERAQETLGSLDSHAESTALCHGDAHRGNLLISAKQPRVLLIDPRGMRGEVEYDIGVLALKLSSYDLQAAQSLCKKLAALAGVDGERAVLWITVARAARV